MMITATDEYMLTPYKPAQMIPSLWVQILRWTFELELQQRGHLAHLAQIYIMIKKAWLDLLFVPHQNANVLRYLKDRNPLPKCPYLSEIFSIVGKKKHILHFYFSFSVMHKDVNLYRVTLMTLDLK